MASSPGQRSMLLCCCYPCAAAGTGEVIATADADLAAFLRGQPAERLNRTAVIVVADHGATMGLNYMYTQNGRVRGCCCFGCCVWVGGCGGQHANCVGCFLGGRCIQPPFHCSTPLPHHLRSQVTEHKIPMLAMLLPRWVEERYPAAAAALRKNEQRLVSGYDFHTTLHHLLHLGESAQPPQKQYAAWAAAGNVTDKVRWGVSLLDEVPAGRSCSDAGVPAEWCQCFAA